MAPPDNQPEIAPKREKIDKQSILDDLDDFIDQEPIVGLEHEIRIYTEMKASCDDPLEFWIAKKNEIPILSAIALRILIVPAASALSERIFSQAGKFNCPSRSSLAAHTLASLTRLKSAKMSEIL